MKELVILTEFENREALITFLEKVLIDLENGKEVGVSWEFNEVDYEIPIKPSDFY